MNWEVPDLHTASTNCPLQNGEVFVSLLSVQVALTCTRGDLANITPMGREPKTKEN